MRRVVDYVDMICCIRLHEWQDWHGDEILSGDSHHCVSDLYCWGSAYQMNSLDVFESGNLSIGRV